MYLFFFTLVTKQTRLSDALRPQSRNTRAAVKAHQERAKVLCGRAAGPENGLCLSAQRLFALPAARQSRQKTVLDPHADSRSRARRPKACVTAGVTKALLVCKGGLWAKLSRIWDRHQASAVRKAGYTAVSPCSDVQGIEPMYSGQLEGIYAVLPPSGGRTRSGWNRGSVYGKVNPNSRACEDMKRSPVPTATQAPINPVEARIVLCHAHAFADGDAMTAVRW
jgi:hypothetical protein